METCISSMSNIPDELKALPQWVCADADSKCPMKAFAPEPASSSDPSTWTDYQTACTSVEHRNYQYLGFVFADNGIVGIDIDAGFEDGKPTELCKDIVTACMSYTEISKSGRGVHIFVKGRLPFSGRNNRNGVEIYQSRRFFITTGNVYHFQHLIENQHGIDYVLSHYFPEYRESGGKKSNRIYTVEWTRPSNGSLTLSPKYSQIPQGCRNISLLSIGGQLKSAGYSDGDILKELLRANQEACLPPLTEDEVRSIAKSVQRYKR